MIPKSSPKHHDPTQISLFDLPPAPPRPPRRPRQAPADPCPQCQALEARLAAAKATFRGQEAQIQALHEAQAALQARSEAQGRHLGELTQTIIRLARERDDAQARAQTWCDLSRRSRWAQGRCPRWPRPTRS